MGGNNLTLLDIGTAQLVTGQNAEREPTGIIACPAGFLTTFHLAWKSVVHDLPIRFQIRSFGLTARFRDRYAIKQTIRQIERNFKFDRFEL